MRKAKHKPTIKRLTVLLLKLQDLKYMQGAKMHIRDALSQFYTEENHQITDIIPLNFLQHTTDNCINETYKYYAQNIYRHNIAVSKSAVNNRKRGRPLKGTICSKDKIVKQSTKQSISTNKQTDKMSMTVWL